MVIYFAGFSRILVSPQSSAVEAGSTMLLPCVAYSYSSDGAVSSLSLTWRRGATLLQNNSNVIIHKEERVSSAIEGVMIIKSILELRNVAAGDSGGYSCRAGTEGREVDMASFQVEVFTSPGKELMMHERSGGKSFICDWDCLVLVYIAVA